MSQPTAGRRGRQSTDADRLGTSGPIDRQSTRNVSWGDGLQVAGVRVGQGAQEFGHLIDLLGREDNAVEQRITRGEDRVGRGLQRAAERGPRQFPAR